MAFSIEDQRTISALTDRVDRAEARLAKLEGGGATAPSRQLTQEQAALVNQLRAMGLEQAADDVETKYLAE